LREGTVDEGDLKIGEWDGPWRAVCTVPRGERIAYNLEERPVIDLNPTLDRHPGLDTAPVSERVIAEETLVADGRAALTPSQHVEQKLIGMLKASPLLVSHVQRRLRPGPR